MGAGYHGGFGRTAGAAERYRIGKVVEPTEKSLEMALNPLHYIEIVSQKYSIHLKGSGKNIEIRFNPELPLSKKGRVLKKSPNIIDIGPGALMSEKELANTMAHELNRSFLRGGNALEKPAYEAGDTLQRYIEGGI